MNPSKTITRDCGNRFSLRGVDLVFSWHGSRGGLSVFFLVGVV